MLTYDITHGHVMVTIEPDDDYDYYEIRDMVTNGYFEMRVKKDSHMCDMWTYDKEWTGPYDLRKMERVEDLQFFKITSRYTSTLPLKKACEQYENN